MTSNFYDEQAETRETGSFIDGRTRLAASMFERHLRTREHLLDIGCGVGSIASYLDKELHFTKVCGVDISEQRVQEARVKGIQAEPCDLNSSALPYAPQSFDAVFCGEVIEHVVDPDKLLDEIDRVLVTNGVCVLTTPNLACWYNRIALALGWQPFHTSVSFRAEVGRPKLFVTDYGCRDHLRVFTLPALKQVLDLHRFSLLEVGGTALFEQYRPDWQQNRARGLVYRVLAPLDALLSKVTSLSTGFVIAFAKK